MVEAMLALVLVLIKPMAKRRKQVMFAGPWPVRMVLRSSSQFQSSTQWQRFSIAQ